MSLHQERQLPLMTSGDGCNLRLLWIHFPFQTSDALLKLAVLGGVYERVDTAVGERQYHGKLVEPASKVDRVAEKTEKEQDLIWCQAGGESAANHQRRDKCVASGCVYHGTISRIHLKEMNCMSS